MSLNWEDTDQPLTPYDKLTWLGLSILVLCALGTVAYWWRFCL